MLSIKRLHEHTLSVVNGDAQRQLTPTRIGVLSTAHVNAERRNTVAVRCRRAYA
jgi:hypothetical protein